MTKRGEPLPINQAMNRSRAKLGLEPPTWMVIVFFSITVFLVGFRILALISFPVLVAAAWLIVRKHPKMFQLWGHSLFQKPYMTPEKKTELGRHVPWYAKAGAGCSIVPISGFVSTAIESDAWHHLSDAITSGFAFIGISVALRIRNPAADEWAALFASPVIIFNAYRKLRHPLAELLDAKPSPEIERQIRSIASKVPGVVGLEKCQVRKVGFSYYVNLHVIVHGDISVSQGHSIAHKVEDTILHSAPRIAEVLVHVEPDEEDQLAKLRGS